MASKVLRIEISRSFQSLGIFKREELKSGYETGQFKSGDFARYEDSGEWRPVEVVVGELTKLKGSAQPETPIAAAAGKKAKKKSEECCCCTMTPADDSSHAGSDEGNEGKTTHKGRIMGFLREVIARF